MTEYKVIIPEEEHSVFKFRQDDLPGVATVNSALDGFEPRIVFSWHLSILIDYKDHIDNKLPSRDERKLLYEFEGKIDKLVKTEGNALFLARVTHGGQIELVWRIYEPKKANIVLQEIVNKKDHPRPFDYRIDPDEKWKKAEWFLKNSRPKSH